MSLLFFFNDTATTEIYTLSLHDALPIYRDPATGQTWTGRGKPPKWIQNQDRSEEHTSELQSHLNLVCRLLLEKKKHQSNRKPASLPDHYNQTYIFEQPKESADMSRTIGC